MGADGFKLTREGSPHPALPWGEGARVDKDLDAFALGGMGRDAGNDSSIADVAGDGLHWVATTWQTTARL